MLARVSNIEAYRKWAHEEPREWETEMSLDDLVRFLTSDEPTEPMRAGTAFHHAIEQAAFGEHDTLKADGYTFRMPDAEIALPELREHRAYRDYGALTVTGQADCVHGRVIIDHKTTGKVDLERYMGGYQWRFYLELFDADVFHWHIFEISETDPLTYRVAAPQLLTAYRYPGIAADCDRLAAEYLEFALEHLPADINADVAA